MGTMAKVQKHMHAVRQTVSKPAAGMPQKKGGKEDLWGRVGHTPVQVPPVTDTEGKLWSSGRDRPDADSTRLARAREGDAGAHGGLSKHAPKRDERWGGEGWRAGCFVCF